jgi:hypothetical protein
VSDGIRIDTSDFKALSATFEQVLPAEAAKTIPQALEVNARKIKDAWNGKLYRQGHAKRTGRSITYDISKFAGFGSTVWQAEIGAVTGSGRQAYITRLLEYGSANNPPHGYGSAALDENVGDLESGLDRALRDAEKAAGLA